MNNLKLKISLLSVFLIANSSVFGDETSDKINSLYEDFQICKQMGVHTITGGLANVGCIASVAVGTIASDYALKNDVPTWVGRTLGITPQDSICQDDTIITAVEWAPFLACCLAGYYILYKTPQWTDKHLLNIEQPRTIKQNLITFLSRQFNWPLGVWTGEYFVRRHAQAQKLLAEKNKIDQAAKKLREETQK